MDNSAHVRFEAKDRSYFAILKKEIHALVVKKGFTEQRTAEIDIIVAEMTSNLIKHGGGGEVLVRFFSEQMNIGVELICVDNGKGIADPSRMMKDGMSTTNTLGQGLGAIKRLSHTFQLYSLKDWGTIVLSRLYNNEVSVIRQREAAEVRSLVLPKPGETESGDGFYARCTKENIHVFLGDGLGHGVEAHAAVSRAIEFLETSVTTRLSPVDTLRQMHTYVKKTRGLVGTIIAYSYQRKSWLICGIGNISTRSQMGIIGKSYMAYNGIIGLNIPNTMKEQVWPGEHGQVVIMASDGIRTRYDLSRYPGILKYDLSILAAAIYKDHARHTDDMSVVVTRINTA